LPDVQIFQTPSEDLAAAHPAQHHRQHHRPVPLRVQRSQQRIHLARHEDARKGASRAHQRNTLSGPLPFPPGRQTPRYRIDRDITASVQIGEQPRHARQSTLHRPRRHTTATIGQPQPAVTTMTLRGDEPEHVSAGHLCRVLADHSEEDLQS
jgi:hypothetical protein